MEELGASWRIFYNNRIYVDTRVVSHALAGNLPILIDKISGAISIDVNWHA